MRPDIAIGTPGYYAIGSDTYPITLIKNTGRVWTIQFDTFTADKANGHNYFGHQKWLITRNPNGRTEEITWRPRWARFRPKGSDCGTIKFGQWYANQDPSF